MVYLVVSAVHSCIHSVVIERWQDLRIAHFLIHCLNDTTSSSSSASSKTDVRNLRMPFSPGQSSQECNIQSLFLMCHYICIIFQCIILKMYYIFVFFMFHFYVSSLLCLLYLYFCVLTKLLGF